MENARYMKIEHICCTKELSDIEERDDEDKVISMENSFSYENISIKFSMYQVHTKSIKVCRISNIIQYKEKPKRKKKQYIVILQSFLTLKNGGLTVLLKVYKLPV